MRFLIRKPGHISRYPGSLESLLWAAWHGECPWAWDQAGQWPACAISKKWGPHLSLKNQVWGLTPAGKVRGMAFQKASRDSHSVSQSVRGDPQDPFRDSLGSSFPNRHDVHFLCQLQPKQPTGRDQTQSSRYEDSAVFQVSHTQKRFTKL